MFIHIGTFSAGDVLYTSTGQAFVDVLHGCSCSCSLVSKYLPKR